MKVLVVEDEETLNKVITKRCSPWRSTMFSSSMS